MKPLDTNPEEVLRQAIQSEVETRLYYQKMAGRTGDPIVRARLLQLAEGEILHRTRLEKRYREVVGQEPPAPLPVTLELPSEIHDLDLRRALKLSLERERESESNYRFMAERVPDTELGKLFMELAEMEWKHKTELQAEYDAAATPEQFLMDI